MMKKLLLTGHSIIVFVALVSLSLLTACGQQKIAAQTPLPGIIPTMSQTPSPKPTITATATPSPRPTETATPCIEFTTPMPFQFFTKWSSQSSPTWSSDDYLDKMSVAQIPVQDMGCASRQEIVSRLMVQWLDTLKANFPSQQQCDLEDYTLEESTIKNIFEPHFDIKVRVDYSVKPGAFTNCDWYSFENPNDPEKDGGWTKTYDVFGIYHKDGFFKMVVLTTLNEGGYIEPPRFATKPPDPESSPTPSCIGLAATPVGTPVRTPIPWPRVSWNELAISRIPIQGMECAPPEEIMRKLLLQWLEMIKTNAPNGRCGFEDYTLDRIMIFENSISPQYDIVAGVGFSVKPGRFESCWQIIPDTSKRGGWILTGNTFAVYREDGFFRLDGDVTDWDP